ncbi:MAG: serine hydrolase domain-containing protein [Actinomycetota bacterium]
MVTTGLADELDELVRTRAGELGVPGVAVGVVDGERDHRCCVGSPTVDDPRPVDAATLFQIGSVSKPLTAIVVAGLVADGLLTPATRLTEVLGDTGLPDVTVGDLLSHRLGLDGDALLCRPPDDPTPAGAVAALAAADGLGAPGVDFSYSNAAYSVLGRVVEVIDDRSFAESLRRRLLRPVRLRRTVTTADEAVTSVVALPHQSHPEGAEPIPGGMGWQPRWELGAHDTAPAGMISCLDDLLRLLTWLLGDGERPISPDERRALWEPVVAVRPGESMASGWFVRDLDGATLVGHPGVTAGYCTLLSLVPERRCGWVVLTNGTAGARLHAEIEALLLDRLLGIDLTAAEDPPPDGDAAEAVGTYVGGLGITTITPSGDTTTLRVEHAARDDGRWQPFPDPPAEVVRHGERLIGADRDGHRVDIPLLRAPDGRIDAILRGRRRREREG